MDYAIPRAGDFPRFELSATVTPTPVNPFGAKGVGEMPIDGPAPAVVNALRHAGYDIRRIPATPEVLLNCAAS
jgi:CO/xanthine dehydrogenase Mo-binding subunit